jgi:hypothetical protein
VTVDTAGRKKAVKSVSTSPGSDSGTRTDNTFQTPQLPQQQQPFAPLVQAQQLPQNHASESAAQPQVFPPLCTMRQGVQSVGQSPPEFQSLPDAEDTQEVFNNEEFKKALHEAEVGAPPPFTTSAPTSASCRIWVGHL